MGTQLNSHTHTLYTLTSQAIDKCGNTMARGGIGKGQLGVKLTRKY